MLLFNIQLLLIFLILYISDNKSIAAGQKLITVILAFFLLVLGLKGGDYTNYFESYNGDYRSYTSLLDSFYIIGNYFNLTFDEFVGVVYIFCSAAIYIVFKRAKTSLLFFTISYFPLYVLLLQGSFRMGVSIIIALVAISYLRRGAIKTSFVFQLLSLYMHVGSGSVLFLYFLHKIYVDYSFNIKKYAYIAFILLVLYILYIISITGYIEKYTTPGLDSASGAFFRLILHAPMIMFIFFNKKKINIKDLSFIKFIYFFLSILIFITIIGYLNSTVLDRVSLVILILISMVLSFNQFSKNYKNLLWLFIIFLVNIIIMNSWFILSHNAQAFWL
jgi:hypothetical protein